MVLKRRQAQDHAVGLWYDDEFVRTADGWRMSRRVEIKCYRQECSEARFLPVAAVLAQWAAVCRGTTARAVVTHVRQNRIRASPPAIAELQRGNHQENSLHHGCQDQAHPAWQDPQSPVPHRRRRRAHPPRRPVHRGHRPLSPEGRPEPHRDRLGARPVLALRRRPAHRTGAGTAEDHRRLAEVQGPAGRRGHAEGQGAQAQQAGPVQRRAGRGRRRSEHRGHHSQEEEGAGQEGRQGRGAAAEATDRRRARRGRGRSARRTSPSPPQKVPTRQPPRRREADES